MYKVFLASSSPRRRLLLEQAQVPFAWASPGIDDATLARGEVSPAQWVASLAFLKASAGLVKLPAQSVVQSPVVRWLVLGADTLVVRDGLLLGQPRDAEDARKILRLLGAGPHEVLTGVAILDPVRGRREIFVDRAISKLGTLSEEMIESYIASGEWQGKAGAYNLDERLAAGWPVEFAGDRATIVGLPMQRLVPRLIALGVKIREDSHRICESHLPRDSCVADRGCANSGGDRP